ncbi:MAG: hypothetical protein HKO57_02015, partial [Akkermansiaceae bacterium]|nr:hypothetical protein [Akkermansiaceae bacterium]
LDPFNTSQNGASSNWGAQGADAGKYGNAGIYAVRILSMEPTTHVGRGPGIGNNWIKGFYNHANERLRILGEIPLRKTDGNGDPVLDPEGNPDTSFLARIPADTPFTFQTIDKDGLVLNMSQTWHQVRPGEVRNDCGGCHAHSQMPLDFSLTAAAQPGYDIRDLALKTPLLSKNAAGDPIVIESNERAVDVEFHRDIEPILNRSCVGCHNAANPSGQLRLDDDAYNRLARDGGATYGIPPIISTGSWRNNNASRYIRKFQARRSLLAWKVFGRRLDGWTNADHPTEAVPGDVSTLPAGAHANQADIDYTGAMMPPPGSGYPPLSEDEKMMIARWIDLGAPVSFDLPGIGTRLGWFADELRPVITVSLPSAGRQPGPLTRIRIGLFDYYSGLDLSTLSVLASFHVNGNAPRAELAPLFVQTGDHVWTLDLAVPVTKLPWSKVLVSVKDASGNLHTVERSFAIGGPAPAPAVEAVTPGGAGGIALDLTGEPQDQLLIERSIDARTWDAFMTILDFDGSQTATDTPAPPRMLYRVSRK